MLSNHWNTTKNFRNNGNVLLTLYSFYLVHIHSWPVTTTHINIRCCGVNFFGILCFVNCWNATKNFVTKMLEHCSAPVLSVQCEASIDALLGTVHKHWGGGGGLMQISIIVKKFGASLFRASFWPGQPHRKACKLDFYWKFLIFFSKASFTRVKHFASAPPSICEHFLTNLDHFKLIFFMIKHYLSVISVSTLFQKKIIRE